MRSNDDMSPEELFSAFHDQVRLGDADLPPGHVVDRDGLVRRTYPADPSEPGAMIETPEGLGADPDAVIAAQVAFFRDRGQRVEWKTYAGDEPADLGHRLAAAGFVPEGDEAVVLGELDTLTRVPELPDGVHVRLLDVADADDRGEDVLAPVRALLAAVWGEGTRWMSDALAEEWQAAPDLLDICVAELEGPEAAESALCAAWVRYSPGTEFAGMWGGATHPDWRHRGLYRAVLAVRARAALERGYRFARVDASPESEPVLLGLGLHRVSTTTPFVLDPGRA